MKSIIKGKQIYPRNCLWVVVHNDVTQFCIMYRPTILLISILVWTIINVMDDTLIEKCQGMANTLVPKNMNRIKICSKIANKISK